MALQYPNVVQSNQFYPGLQPAAQTPVVYQTQPLYTTAISPQPLFQAAPVVSQPVPVAAPKKGVPWREPLLTTLGEVILVSEFPNALKQAKHAIIPWLQMMNMERATLGLHQIGVREVHVKDRRQTLPFTITDAEKFLRNLVVFVMPGTGIRNMHNPKSKTDYKELYSQANDGFNEIVIFIVGPIIHRTSRAGFTPSLANPNHNDLCDPVLETCGIFQGDPVATRLMKSGMLFSFAQFLNEKQFNRLTYLLRRLSNQCHVTTQKSKLKFHR